MWCTHAYITRCETVGFCILLANLKFGDRLFNRQITKLKPPPKFPVIRYVLIDCVPFLILLCYCINYASDWTGLINLCMLLYLAGVPVFILWSFHSLAPSAHVFAATFLFPVYHAPGCLFWCTLYGSHLLHTTCIMCSVSNINRHTHLLLKITSIAAQHLAHSITQGIAIVRTHQALNVYLLNNTNIVF